MMFDSTSSAMSQIKAVKLRPLAVTSPKRSTALPDVPTLTEQGITGADVTTWYGLLTTGGTPPAIVTRLNKELNATLQLPAVAARIKGLGGEIDLITDQEFPAMNTSEDAHTDQSTNSPRPTTNQKK